MGPRIFGKFYGIKTALKGLEGEKDGGGRVKCRGVGEAGR